MTARLKAGDWVEVRPVDEILATLDEDGCLDGLPFMPEMLPFAGQRLRVAARAHKTCDTVNKTGGRRMSDAVHLENSRCDGSAHGGCNATCLIFWKQAWLRPVSDEGKTGSGTSQATPTAGEGVTSSGLTAAGEEAFERLKRLARHTDSNGDTVYRCQATALYDATTSLKWWDLSQYAEDLTSRNVGPRRLLSVAFFQTIYNLMQLGVGYRLWRKLYEALKRRSGQVYPFRSGELSNGARTPVAALDLQPGELVRVKPLEQILATIDQRKMNRGMRFDPEMVPYCGKTYTVVKRVERIIDEGTGKMLEMATPSIILDGVVCRSEFSKCRLFCPRAITPYWREIWLERVKEASAEASTQELKVSAQPQRESPSLAEEPSGT